MTGRGVARTAGIGLLEALPTLRGDLAQATSRHPANHLRRQVYPNNACEPSV